jgi:basic membrane lipoprotein Med (substrate-binding protein (PBP1-ABC) superfamily)
MANKIIILWIRGKFAVWPMIIAALLAGCTRSPNHGEPAGAPHRFRVALLTPGPISDAGWNASAYDGLKLIERELGAETAQVQTGSPADFEDAFRDFGARGFDLVFAHGFEYSDAALAVGRNFPRTFFVVTSGSGASANVASLAFRIEDATYVEGVLAGGVTKTGVVGEIGGIEIPQIKITFEAFRRGFLSVRPDGRVLMTYTGSFDDVGAAKEAALAEVSQKADVLFHNTDAAGLGVFEAAAQAKVMAFGINRDQSEVAPDWVVASAIADIPGAFLKVAREVRAGRFRARTIEFGMRDGMVRVVYNPKLRDRIPSAALARANQAERAIIAGQIAIASHGPPR